MEEYKISIIVPVFNVEKFLQSCIESIVGQTWQNWELILVDDGSTDCSSEICEEFSQRDSRISHHKKQNGGVSSARNVGLSYADGDFITFIDSDDTIDPCYLSDFEADKINADMYCAGAVYDVEGKPYSYIKYQRKYCTGRLEIRDNFFDQNFQNNGYPWGKLFRRSVIEEHHMRFNEKLTICEDHLFAFQYMLYCETMFVTATAGYHYLVFDNSGRKLSDKINSYSELRLASEAFLQEIRRMRTSWSLNEQQLSELTNEFVLFRRLLALRSIALLGDWQHFDDEIEYWVRTAFHPANAKHRLALFLVRLRLPKPLKKLLLSAYYKSWRALAKNKTVAVYEDLRRRSTLYNPCNAGKQS